MTPSELSEQFRALFDAEYPRDTFDSEEEYQEYRRSARMWFFNGAQCCYEAR